MTNSCGNFCGSVRPAVSVASSSFSILDRWCAVGEGEGERVEPNIGRGPWQASRARIHLDEYRRIRELAYLPTERQICPAARPDVRPPGGDQRHLPALAARRCARPA